MCIRDSPGGLRSATLSPLFECCWWVQRSEAPRGPERDLAVPGGLWRAAVGYFRRNGRMAQPTG
eukprot:273093-Pyramimonas_sp.AAC.1